MSKGERLLEQRERNRVHLNKETPIKRKTRLITKIELQNSLLKAEIPRKRFARCLDLSECQPSRIAGETEADHVSRLKICGNVKQL